MNEFSDLKAQWQAAWPDALALWSRFTRLQTPRFCTSREQEKQEGIAGSFAMIRLSDHVVVISLAQIAENGLHDFALPILAHEIGHHIFCPGDLGDHARTMARMRHALPTKENFAPLVANLYTDLLINDRLQTQHGLPMDEVYRVLEARKTSEESQLWTFYLRTYEILWSLPKGDLARGSWSATLEADAVLGARVVRSYAKDWLRGSGRFAALCLTYLMHDDDSSSQKAVKIWLDASGALGGDGQIPDGLTQMDDDEIEGARHPAFDENLSGVKETVPQENAIAPVDQGGSDGTGSDNGAVSSTRYREIGEYIEVLRAVGVTLSDHEIAIRYYRERAVPHLIRFPARVVPQSREMSPEGVEAWEIGDTLESLDLLESTFRNPQIVPGYTTVKRTFGEVAGGEAQREIDDLYLGIDCSGSMPNPQQQLSFPVLAAVVMAISALRAGARVMAVLSGDPGPQVSTEGFLRDEHRVLEVLTGYLGSGYAFGVHRMTDTFEARDNISKNRRNAHIVLVTDADLFRMMDTSDGDHKAAPPHDLWSRARHALQLAGKGTAVLNIDETQYVERVARLRNDGWRVHSVRNWDELLDFARNFSRENYEK